MHSFGRGEGGVTEIYIVNNVLLLVDTVRVGMYTHVICLM